MERREVADRQFDALLERLDRIAQQLEKIDRRLEAQEGLVLISKELRSLEESLNALAYAALGQLACARASRSASGLSDPSEPMSIGVFARPVRRDVDGKTTTARPVTCGSSARRSSSSLPGCRIAST